MVPMTKRQAPLVDRRRLTDQTTTDNMMQGPASAEVPPHERVRGFLYGGEVLPVDQAAEEALKWGEEEVSWLVVRVDAGR